LLLLFAVLVGAAGASHAADAGEITFWESVRDSKDPAELRAYLQRYPNGTFAVLAQRRLAVLESGSRPVAPVAPAAPAAATVSPPSPAPKVLAWEMPKAADTWTYRLREPKRREGPAERTLVVTVVSASPSEVADQATLDGASPPLQASHTRGGHLLAQGVAVFSPYFPLFSGMPAVGSAGRVQIDASACSSRHLCEAKGRIVGKETVRVAAGTFVATKIVIEQSWRATFAGSGGGAGGRTLTVWYAPEARRAVKYLSRAIVGFNPPIEPDFELELVSYKVD
jgi:hypothetical protein